MLVDPLKSVNRAVNVTRLNNRTDKIVNEVVSFLIENYSQVIGSNEYGTKNKVSIENIIREKINKDYNYSNIDTEELIKIIIDKIFGYNILQKYIDDLKVSDIRAVKWNSIYIMKEGKWLKVSDSFANETEFYNFVRYCVIKNNGKITYEQPIVVVSDKENHLRIEAGISPVNIVSPSLVVRIHRPDNNVSLENLYYDKNMMNNEMYEFLKQVVLAGCNVIIAGKGGSGKTTLLRAILNDIPDTVSITSNEETAELYSNHGNMIQREIVKNRATNNILLEDLTRHSLVMSNDAIVIGELKGSEAMAFFDGISTGHIGYATVHSESANLVIDRLVTLMKRDILAQQYTDKYLKDILAQSIDVIIYMRNFKIYEMCAVEFSYEKEITYKRLFEFVPDYIDENGVQGKFFKREEPTAKILKKINLVSKS
ncbi:MAG: CpaF family protein [Clostridia bacterium]|nr:CpaF family protein [Clostridia bacterium]